MSNVTIPAGAMPIVEILRRDVERPTAKIIARGNGKEPVFKCGKCPMGLLPSATSQRPIEGEFEAAELRRLRYNVRRFYRWWDELTIQQAYEALDLIWPK